MRYVAIAFATCALVLSLLLLWRASQAAGDRDNQPADSNDVVVALSFAAVAIVFAQGAVVFAVLA